MNGNAKDANVNEIIMFICILKVDGCAQIWAQVGDKVSPDQEHT